MAFTSLSQILDIAQSIVAESSTFFFNEFHGGLQTAEFDIIGIILSIKVELMNESDKHVVHFLHTPHFLLKFFQGLAGLLSGIDLGECFDLHHSTVDHGGGFKGIDEVSELVVEAHQNTVILLRTD